MQFNSYIFILCFLPLTLCGYFLCNHFKRYQLAKAELLLMSLWFYGYFNKYYLLIICVSILLNYGLSKFLLNEKLNQNLRKAGVIFSVAANLGLLFYFKYFDFFIENVNAVFGASFNLRHIVLPLGISFFTFQQLSYVIDSYRLQTADYGFLDYAVFVAFFPQLVAGPIVLHGEMIPQFRQREKKCLDYGNLSRGIYVFSIGLFKKVIIADTFGKAVAWGYGSIDTLGALEALIVMLSYTFQIYFDFSGYCDMAVGIAAMFNIRLPMNFNSPYKAVSIVDFWNRWHMTLTRFLREYLYFPLGGSRKGKLRTYLNIMIVFLASGLWHGANWTFILWGAIHGLGNVITRAGKNIWDKFHVSMRWFITFLFVNLAWVLFRADSAGQAVRFIKRLFYFDFLGIREELAVCFSLPEITYLFGKLRIAALTSRIYGFDMWVFLTAAFGVVLCFQNCFELKFRPTAARAVYAMGLLVWAVLSLSGITTFLYFNF